jgi:hypothetical protein
VKDAHWWPKTRHLLVNWLITTPALLAVGKLTGEHEGIVFCAVLAAWITACNELAPRWRQYRRSRKQARNAASSS